MPTANYLCQIGRDHTSLKDHVGELLKKRSRRLKHVQGDVWSWISARESDVWLNELIVKTEEAEPPVKKLYVLINHMNV